ncbi:MAG: hypothetical protein IT359_07055 [Gemmatimonadaceae bacterium]|nr:hypothetical protein [Gemmatimonadaceae bacterium]
MERMIEVDPEGEGNGRHRTSPDSRDAADRACHMHAPARSRAVAGIDRRHLMMWELPAGAPVPR